MNLPKIDITTLPDLDVMTGLFGSLHHQVQAYSDDSIVMLMTIIFEVLSPTR